LLEHPTQLVIANKLSITKMNNDAIILLMLEYLFILSLI